MFARGRAVNCCPGCVAASPCAVSFFFCARPLSPHHILPNSSRPRRVAAPIRHHAVGRFHSWLRDARDWAISRNRYWGTPLPIWASEDYEEIVVVGSIEELRARTGRADVGGDLHREAIDHLTIPSSRPGHPPLRRIDGGWTQGGAPWLTAVPREGSECESCAPTDPNARAPFLPRHTPPAEVFDCWFESGSMPYAQVHYPFAPDSASFLESRFPAAFIAEGLDQTRGWFYTLMVLSTALFDKPAFTNLIVNGLVLAEDGKKMSKRLKNYPDPTLVVDKYGADALRLYLIDSPVVRAEPLRFREAGVLSVVKDLFLPW